MYVAILFLTVAVRNLIRAAAVPGLGVVRFSFQVKTIPEAVRFAVSLR